MHNLGVVTFDVAGNLDYENLDCGNLIDSVVRGVMCLLSFLNINGGGVGSRGSRFSELRFLFSI